MFAFTNTGASCYMDSLLVALFYPEAHRPLYNECILNPTPRKPMDILETWELQSNDHLKQLALDALRRNVARLQAHPTEGWPLVDVRNALTVIPYRDGINFGLAGQQSAVDFLRFLFTLCNVRDSLVNFQVSTTLYQSRPQVDARMSSPGALLQLWAKSARKEKYSHANAHACTDASERFALERDETNVASYSVNEHGDMRRISAVQQTSVFLCHLTALDTEALICRDLLPIIEQPESGYTGKTSARLHAHRLIDAPVLIFEVSRRVYTPEGTEHKSTARVNYGVVTEDNAHVLLNVHDKTYALQAIVCHYGTSTSGHYIAFVQGQPGEWHVYDDALSPQMFRLENNAASLEHVGTPSLNGELFFYVPVEQ